MQLWGASMEDWNDLRYILAVARHGTLTEGARALGVDPTTVARRLRSIEEGTQVTLFEKLKHGAVLSAAGEEMVSVAEAIEQMTHALDARVQGLDAKLEGTVRVTAIDRLLTHWMPDLAAFTERYPDVRLELTSSYQLVNLTRRDADVAVRIAPSAPEHLIGRKEAELFFAIYASPELVEGIGDSAGYDAFPWLAWDLSIGRATDAYLATHVPKARVVLRVDKLDLMLAALEAGIGVTILPCFVGDTRAKLRRVGPYFEGGTFLWSLTHPELRGSARIRALLAYVRELVQRDRALLEGRQPQPTCVA